MYLIISSHKLQLLCSLVLFTFSLVSASGCYISANSTIDISYNFIPCESNYASSAVVNCCDLQAGHVCMSDKICFDPSQSENSGFYISGCTDPTYSNSTVCPRYCSESEGLLCSITIRRVLIDFSPAHRYRGALYCLQQHHPRVAMLQHRRPEWTELQ